MLETYITHIRITEYSTNPTGPPPPQARTPQSQKPRVIIVAVRKSGRVRMHKSKENANGTFSIGKTWNLDDLSAIESFSSPAVNANYREWAGDVGFIVILGKPYYWQAQTDKEKKFFIASLVKIYGKYTGGRTPMLNGFDSRELEQVLGGAQAARRQGDRSGSGSGSGSGSAPSRPPIRPNPVDSSSVTSSYTASTQPFQTPTPTPPPPGLAERAPSRGPALANGGPSPARSFDAGRRSNEQTPRQDLLSLRQDANSLRRLASNNQSQDSVAAASSLAAPSDDASLRPRSRNGLNGGRITPEPPPPPLLEEQPPPERKRPPMDPLRPRTADQDLVPAPLMSPVRREPLVPPRSADRISPRTAASERAASSGEALGAAEAVGSVPTPAARGTVTSPPATTDTPATGSPTEPDEESRPGLGPMIKAKKSRTDVAGAFWKAAAAASAFKPRPGGAAERLRFHAAKATEGGGGPDGITGVVPAPPPPPAPVPAPAPAPAPAPEPLSTPTAEPATKTSTRASGTPATRPEVQVTGSTEREPEPSSDRKSMVMGNDTKYLSTMGIDPSILDKRSIEYAKWLDYFGWVPGEPMRTMNSDEMKMDMERELNKAQAGGWLARFQHEDERVDSIKKGIDLAIDECDELDNLLTLYSVELSVRGPSLPSPFPLPHHAMVD